MFYDDPAHAFAMRSDGEAKQPSQGSEPHTARIVLSLLLPRLVPLSHFLRPSAHLDFTLLSLYVQFSGYITPVLLEVLLFPLVIAYGSRQALVRA